MSPFSAFRISQDEATVRGQVVPVELDDLGDGDVVARVSYSDVNYKDALAATGTGKIIRQFPLIGGIDFAGTVVSSRDTRYSDGDDVLVTGFGLGERHDGGFAEFVRVPADWVVPLPDGLNAFEAMAIGTAGLTAALSVIALERNGLRPSHGPVIVTGATGGVGSLAVQCLSTAGYSVTALTRKTEAADFLRSLGASEVLVSSDVVMGTRPLEQATWAGAVDPVGGETLAWLTRTMKHGASIASSGLTGGTQLNTTVLPFILRGVNLLGIDSVMCPVDERREAWRRLGSDLKPRQLDVVARVITLDELPQAFQTLLEGKVRGRFVVRIASGEEDR